MGVSGTGKTTVGRALADAICARFVDADDLHSAANVDRMRRGIPLTDEDREPWLGALRETVDRALAEPGVTVLACSALTARSRQRLGVEREGVRLVFLRGSTDLIELRMRGRRHFMRPELLASQLSTLEPPAEALELDVAMPVDVLVERIRSELGV
ncbi:MAG: AAA family ATPase [Gammaproteobacteria bacterium]|nr:AAA family ATPase [Gammaproteobacteria bacterium]